MPIETIEFNGQQYPAFQAQGNAARWIMPFAMEICQPTGTEIGFDIGCNRLEWAMPGAIGIDPALPCPLCDERLPSMHEHYNAYKLPDIWMGRRLFLVDIAGSAGVDYIFSSHCLEHLPKWVDALDYWWTRLKPGGVVFLYLPDQSQDYWRPWNNRKHVHSFTPELLRMYFELSENGKMWTKVFVSGVDLNNSFCCIAERV